MIKSIKRFLNTDWIVIKIDKKFLVLVLVVAGLLWAKDYIYMKGVVFGYGVAKQDAGSSQDKQDDSDTHNEGHFDHSHDPISL